MKSKLRLIAVILGVLTLLFVAAWPQRQSQVTTVYFPDGSIKILSEQSITNSQWHVYALTPSSPVSVRGRVNAFLGDVLHRANLSIPNPPRLVDLAGNMRPGAEWSHTTILVADELFSISGTNWLAFEFGANKNAATTQGWLQSNLDCIRTNGAVTVAPNGRILTTTPCAIIVSGQNIKIVPAYQISKI